MNNRVVRNIVIVAVIYYLFQLMYGLTRENLTSQKLIANILILIGFCILLICNFYLYLKRKKK